MTHLIIKQDNGITEQVSPSVIEKLYEIVHSGNLDSSSNLMGSLNTTSTYLDYVDYLEELFTKNGVRLLIIEANRKYIRFEDPEVLRITLAHNVGDDTGVTLADLTSVTNINDWFKNNTTITSLNDLLKFTNVTSITNIATNDTNLISVTLGEGILEITGNCFYNCSSLLTINFPTSLTKINDNRQFNDWGAFQGCTSLTTITGGENIMVLGPAFTNCSNLLNLGDINLSNLIHLGGACFANCENLELGSVTLSNSITTIADTVFKACRKLTSISIPGVTTITPSNNFAQGSFCECNHLTTVTGSNIDYVGQMSFRYCSALSSIDLSNCTYIGACAFQDCTSLTSIDLSSCTTIAGSAFTGCTSLSSVTLNNNLTTLLDSVFKNCTSLTSIDLSNISTIGNSQDYEVGVFLNCTSLLTVTGLSSIDYIGPQTFKGCSNLGTGLDLVLNPTGNVGSESFLGTAFKSVTVNGSNCTSILGYNIHQAFYNMANCVTFDFSNTKITQSLSFGTRTSMKTVIYPSTFSIITWDGWGYYNNNDVLQYYIILATTPPTYENATYCKLINGNFYVPDSAVNDYKSAWPQTGYLSWDIHAHIKPLSELPAGVWTTGLASQYLTPALLATS